MCVYVCLCVYVCVCVRANARFFINDFHYNTQVVVFQDTRFIVLVIKRYESFSVCSLYDIRFMCIRYFCCCYVLGHGYFVAVVLGAAACYDI